MIFSRRRFPVLLAALVRAEGQDSSRLPSAVFPFAGLPVHTGTTSTARQVFRGTTHSGFPVDLHETDLPPGHMPHAAHRHEWEEVIMLSSGQLDVTVNGQTTTIGPGSAAYLGSNDLHGLKNSGTMTARYFVMAFGQQSS